MSSSIHLRPPFRAEHVGSLIRTRALYEKRREFEAGKCTAGDLKPFEDEAIKHVVKLQQDLGIKTITDGEMRRSTLLLYPVTRRLNDLSCNLENTFLRVSSIN